MLDSVITLNILGPEPPIISLKEKVVKVLVNLITNYPKETKVVKEKFTDAEWNEMKDFMSSAGKKNVKQ